MQASTVLGICVEFQSMLPYQSSSRLLNQIHALGYPLLKLCYGKILACSQLGQPHNMTCKMSDRTSVPAERNLASSCKDVQKLNNKDFAEFWESFDTVLTDCDGVLWLQNSVIPGAPDVIKKFKEVGKKVFYVTNNSTKTRDEFISKCSKLEFPAVRDDILSTAYLTACYFQGLKFDKKIYVVGSKGIGQELDAIGISHVGIGPDPVTTDFANVPQQIELDHDVGAVVVGMDEHVSFAKLAKAASYLSDLDCQFVATNTDKVYPSTAHHLVIPGTGSIVAAVETAAGREAFKIGKPSTFLRDFLIREHKIDPTKTLMIGDRCDTDILFGRRSGFRTLLVLTGVTSLEQVNKWKASDKKEEQDLVPDYYIKSLGDLLHLTSKG